MLTNLTTMFSPSHKRKQEEDDVLLGTGVHVKNNGPRKRVRIGEAEYLDASGVAQAHTKDVDDSEDLELMKGRRGAVKMEGYDSESDSSGAEEDGAEVVEEEGDMFADEAEAPLPAATGSTNGGKKEDKFLRLESIEGQVWRDDAEDFAGEVKLTPFNMEEEMEEGDFDESGHYIRKRDEHLIHDSWLQGVTKNDMEKARAAHAKQEELANESEAEIDGVRDPNHIWLKAIHLMKPGESIPKVKCARLVNAICGITHHNSVCRLSGG
ncbi:hypothetical protein HKX48_007261 [Thoreauomyces humboldtii]|nr:hypothetical protein HKX48_007261 [Thoreauomyces humboldtii]